MKTLTHFFTDYTIQPLKQLCTELFSSLWLSPQERSLLREITNKEKQTKKSSISERLNKILRALADLGALVSNSKVITKAFPRFVTGLVLLVLVAPYADTFYTNFDFYDRVPPEVWYYESLNWLFLCLGPYLKSFITVIGLYMCLVHEASPIKTALAAYCLMYDAGKILWLLFVQNHDEYRTLTPKMFLLYGLVTSAFVLYMLDLLSYWFNHRVRAIMLRLEGIRGIVGKVEAEKIVESFAATMDANKKVEKFQP